MVIKRSILRGRLFWSTMVMRKKTPEPKYLGYMTFVPFDFISEKKGLRQVMRALGDWRT